MEKYLYDNPLVERYSSKEMLKIFSPHFKFTTWRKLWVYLAEAEKKAGIAISDEQINALKKNIDNLDFAYVKEKENELRHDVMAHIHAFAKVAPEAAGIIHLGATSAYVGDNTDLIQYREALKLISQKTLGVIKELKAKALEFKSIPTLAYTHFQVAQPTTVGKRIALWMQDLLFDYKEIKRLISEMPFRGVKGTTGSQASIMKLFNRDTQKVKEVEAYVLRKAGFKNLLPLTGQTYTRKIDYFITSRLSNLAQSAAKFANDLRLLSHLKEMEEPFVAKQVGSSAMPYKRNPIRSERINSLARYVVVLANSTAHTSSTQWLERSLDDSANKRLSLPECFLGVDAILDIYQSIAKGLKVNLEIVKRNYAKELPFIILEDIMMDLVKQGENRQEMHELIREKSLKANETLKKTGKNPLLSLLAKDKKIHLKQADLKQLQDPYLYTGRSEAMVDEFIDTEISPLLKKNKFISSGDIKV